MNKNFFYGLWIATLLALAGLWPYGLHAGALNDGVRRARDQEMPSGIRLAAAHRTARIAHSTEVKRLIAAANDKGERELNLSWGQQSFGGARGAKLFQDLFNRMYDMNIKVNFTPAPRMSKMVAQVTQEVAAGQAVSTDILLGTEIHFGRLLKKDVLENYDFTRLSPRITKKFVPSISIGVEVATFVSGVVYNTNLVSAAEAPRKLEDVLQAKWKGKIASTPFAAQLYNIAFVSTWSPEKMKAFVGKLSPYVAGLIRCGELSRIASGEFTMMVMGCGSYAVRQQRAKGAPLGHVILEDGATVSFFYWGLPRNSAYPNLAKLFINMAMSEAGQRVVYESYDTDHYLMPGSQSVAELKGLKAKGVEMLEIDADFVAKHPEMRKLARQLAKILRKKK